MTGTIMVEAAAAEPTAAPTNPPTDTEAVDQTTAVGWRCLARRS